MKTLLILMLIPCSLYSQQIEQKAFDHFLSDIFIQDYAKEGKVYFSGFTENHVGISGLFAECIKSDSTLLKLLYEFKKIESEKLPIELLKVNSNKIRLSNKTHKKGINIDVYRAVVQNKDSALVYISVYKVNHFVSHYLFRVESNNNTVVELCRINEII